MQKKKRGFTLAELIVAMIGATILFAGACGVYQLAIKRWNVQSSYGLAVDTADTALDEMQKEARNAISFSTVASGSNTLYVFTLPGAANGQTSQPGSGQQYQPSCSNGTLQYVAGSQVAFYLSDLTGSQNVSNGTVIWRATAPAGSSAFTPDSSWSLSNATVARCPGVQSMNISTSGMPTNTVDISITVTDTSTKDNKTYTVSREQYMNNNNGSSGNLGGCSSTAGTTGGANGGSTTGSTTGSTSGSTTGSSSGSSSGSTTGGSNGCGDNGKGNGGEDNGNHNGNCGGNDGNGDGNHNGDGNGNQDGGDNGNGQGEDNGNGNGNNDNGNHNGDGNGNQDGGGNDNGNH